MKSFRPLAMLLLAFVGMASLASAQTPTITSFFVRDTRCSYKVGHLNNPCSIGPGMTLSINGSNFGPPGGTVTLCDCPAATIVTWHSGQVIAIVNSVNPNANLYLETLGGSFSNNVTYVPLGPVITSIVVGNCTYVPDKSPNLCKIAPGTQFTINGSYFGPSTDGGIAVTCTSCGNGNAAIDSWDPNWLTNPSPYNNQIVATATQAVCGATIGVYVDDMWSNWVAYTVC